ncbi:hypothetical protein SDC9_191667 [bioreactor metagenome]|uniref:Uncharacterized protein n=1 Tax=bioreactor metagenome TaxID=1076179 RepID=A0A645HZT5_9ZZZZ
MEEFKFLIIYPYHRLLISGESPNKKLEALRFGHTWEIPKVRQACGRAELIQTDWKKFFPETNTEKTLLLSPLHLIDVVALCLF